MSTLNAAIVNSTGGVRIPIYTTATRPTGVDGLMIVNSTTNTIQVFYTAGGGWVDIANTGVQTFTNAVTYSFTGQDQYFTVPSNLTYVKQLSVKVWGAGGGGAGGNNRGGAGGFSTGIIKRVDNATLASNTFTIVVGEGGSGGGNGNNTNNVASYGGGGAGSWDGGAGGHRSGSGGGLSGIFSGSGLVYSFRTPQSGTLSRAIIIAGGGGGANDQNSTAADGGSGGGTSGQNGFNLDQTQYTTEGGTQSAGYANLNGEDGSNRGADNPGSGSGYWSGRAGQADGGGAGGGSGYIGGNASYSVTSGLTYTGDRLTPPSAATSDSYYLSGTAVGGPGDSNNIKGGHGRVIILY